ncbi:MAG: A24 family peptidase [Alphaproteobacteria bacterium]
MTASLLLVAVVPALLVLAAAWDLVSFTIPNLFPAALVLLFAVFALVLLVSAEGGSAAAIWSDLGWHFAAALIALAAGVALYATGLVGGGDAKLFAAASLWLGWNALFEYTLYASLLGGALTLALLAMRKLPLPAMLHGQSWLLRLADRGAGVPYGIALAAAALIMLPESDLFRLAAGH